MTAKGLSSRAMTDQDLFGEGFRDYLNGNISKFELERDDGYVDEQDYSQYFVTYDDFPDVERDALKEAKGRVLDLGVGAGRVALYLQEKGLDVTGVDISDHSLDVCRNRGVKKLVRMSVCDLRFEPGSFDTAIAFGNNFGLCGTVAGVESMLRRLHDIMSDDGIFLAESIEPENTTNPAHLEYHKKNRAKGLLPGQVRLRCIYKGRVSDWWGLLMVSPDELRTLCARTGWKVERIYKGRWSPPFFVGVLKKS